MDVSRDWLDGFVRRAIGICACPTPLQAMPNFSHRSRICRGRCGLGSGRQAASNGAARWVLWPKLVTAGIEALQLPPARIKLFALSRGTRAKTGRIDARLIARFMLFTPEAGRRLPSENLRILRTLTTRRAQIADMRKRLLARSAHAGSTTSPPGSRAWMMIRRPCWTPRSVTSNDGSKTSSHSELAPVSSGYLGITMEAQAYA
ncbi:IS110 family transposase [Paenirhodobacter populi]